MWPIAFYVVVVVAAMAVVVVVVGFNTSDRTDKQSHEL